MKALHLVEIPLVLAGHIPFARYSPSKKPGHIIACAVDRSLALFNDGVDDIGILRNLAAQGLLQRHPRTGHVLQIAPCCFLGHDTFDQGQTWTVVPRPHYYLRGEVHYTDHTLRMLDPPATTGYWLMNGYHDDTGHSRCRVV